MKNLISIFSILFLCVQTPCFADTWDGTRYLFTPKTSEAPAERGVNLPDESWGFKTGESFNLFSLHYDYSNGSKKLQVGAWSFTGTGLVLAQTVSYKDKNRVTLAIGVYIGATMISTTAAIPAGAILVQPVSWGLHFITGKLSTGNDFIDKTLEGFAVGYGYNGHGYFLCSEDVTNLLNKVTNK